MCSIPACLLNRTRLSFVLLNSDMSSWRGSLSLFEFVNDLTTHAHTRAHKPMFKFLQYVWTCLDKHNQQQSSRSVTHAFSSTLPRFSPLCSSQKQVHVHTHECLNRARTLWCWRTRTTHGTSDLEKTSSKQSTAVIDCIRSEPQLITVGFGGTSHTVLNL